MSKTQELTVFVVDDDAAVLDSITELVESVGLRVEAYASGSEFLEAFQPDRPGCLVLDVRMGAMSGLVLQEKLGDLGATIPIIVLTGHGDVQMAVQAMKSGAVDFIQKPYREQALLDSINAALASDCTARNSSNATGELEQRLADLTEREREVLDQIVTGATSKEVARKLDVSPRTIETHRHNLLRKLGIGSVKELMGRLASQARGS